MFIHTSILQLVLFFNVICLACYALLFFFGCDNIKMAGATMPYFNSGEILVILFFSTILTS